MKKIYLLFVLFWLPVSCFEEQVPAKYFVGTIWGAFETGGIYNDDNTLDYVYAHTHDLTLHESTFSHVIYRKEAAANSIGFVDKDTINMVGTYSLHYPDIVLKYNNDVSREGKIEFEVLTIAIEEGRNILLFLRKTPT